MNYFFNRVLLILNTCFLFPALSINIHNSFITIQVNMHINSFEL
jgi:hypothetical protein